MKTLWLWLLGIGAAYEIYTIANKERGDTLSELVWKVKHPLLSFGVGLVVGHWFWAKSCETCEAENLRAKESEKK